MHRGAFAALWLRVGALTPASLFRLWMRTAICFSVPFGRPRIFRTYVTRGRNCFPCAAHFCYVCSVKIVMWGLLPGDEGTGGSQLLWNYRDLNGSLTETAQICVPMPSSWDTTDVLWSWALEMAVINSGLIHLHSAKVILYCVSFAAFVFLTLMLGDNAVYIPQNLHWIFSDYSVCFLIWSRHVLKEVHTIGPIDKADVCKVLIKLERNLSISLMLL